MQEVTDYLPADPKIELIKEVMRGQHAIHGVFADVFDRLGGEDFLYEWALDNPGRFLQLFVKMTPNLMPQQGVQGDVHLHVHPVLGRTELDD